MANAVQDAVGEPTSILEVLHDWVATVDHKKIGIMYVLMSVVFLIIAGLEAVLMRLQLLQPNMSLVPPDTFNQLFTMHGTTMVFFVGMPILIGVGNFAVPLQIGAATWPFRGSMLSASGRRCSAACWFISASPPAAGPTSAGSPTRL